MSDVWRMIFRCFTVGNTASILSTVPGRAGSGDALRLPPHRTLPPVILDQQWVSFTTGDVLPTFQLLSSRAAAVKSFGHALDLAVWLGRHAPDGPHRQATVRLTVSHARHSQTRPSAALSCLQLRIGGTDGLRILGPERPAPRNGVVRRPRT